MLELPAGAPLELTWFVAWGTFSGALAYVNRELGDASGQLMAEAKRRSDRSLDELNEYLKRELRTGSTEGPPYESPVSDRHILRVLHGKTCNAWNPLARHERYQQYGRLVQVLCSIEFMAAIVGGGAWWAIKQERSIIAAADWILFFLLLLPILACIGYRIWAHFSIGESPFGQ